MWEGSTRPAQLRCRHQTAANAVETLADHRPVQREVGKKQHDQQDAEHQAVQVGRARHRCHPGCEDTDDQRPQDHVPDVADAPVESDPADERCPNSKQQQVFRTTGSPSATM